MDGLVADDLAGLGEALADRRREGVRRLDRREVARALEPAQVDVGEPLAEPFAHASAKPSTGANTAEIAPVLGVRLTVASCDPLTGQPPACAPGVT